MVKSDTVVTPLFKAASAVLILAFTLHTVGFSTPNWIEGPAWDNQTYRAGLWLNCKGDLCAGGGGHNLTKNEWFRAVQTFEAIGFACQAIAVIISVSLFTAVSNHRLARVNVHVCVFAGIFIVIGTGTFTWKTRFELLGYSCWLAWTASLVLMFAIIFFECDHHRKSSARRQQIIEVNMMPSEHEKNGYRRPRFEVHTQQYRHHPYTRRHLRLDRNRPVGQRFTGARNHMTGSGQRFTGARNHMTGSRHQRTCSRHQVARHSQSASEAANQNRPADQHYLFVSW